jgi:competence protein ComEA
MPWNSSNSQACHTGINSINCTFHLPYMIDKIVNFFKNLLHISYKDAQGFFKLLMICFLAIALYFGAKVLMTRELSPSADDLMQLDSMVHILDSAMELSKQPVLFSFDPNTLSFDSLILLGIPEKLAGRLINYRKSGASFRVKSDLTKVYGFPEDIYASLLPFISLPDSVSKSTKIPETLLDINFTDEQALVSCANIDVALAKRIVKYRQLLGGFIHEDQLAEVYGIITDLQFRIEACVFVRKGFTPKKVRLNNADENTLKTHPYISDALADDILRYREVNGAINSIEELAGFKSANTADFEKLISYLDFTN